MTALIAFPTVLIRVAAEVALGLVAWTVLLPRDRRAGLGLGAVSAVVAATEIVAPVVELGGFMALSSAIGASPTPRPPDAWWFVLVFLLELLPPLGHATLLVGCVLTILRLAKRLPREERDGTGWTR